MIPCPTFIDFPLLSHRSMFIRLFLLTASKLMPLSMSSYPPLIPLFCTLQIKSLSGSVMSLMSPLTLMTWQSSLSTTAGLDFLGFLQSFQIIKMIPGNPNIFSVNMSDRRGLILRQYIGKSMNRFALSTRPMQAAYFPLLINILRKARGHLMKLPELILYLVQILKFTSLRPTGVHCYIFRSQKWRYEKCSTFFAIVLYSLFIVLTVKLRVLSPRFPTWS